MTPEQLAFLFLKKLLENVTFQEWKEIRRRNGLPEYDDGACATHDFMDANMVMLDAFEELAGRSMVMEDSDEAAADAALWNAAWDIAKEQYLTHKEKP